MGASAELMAASTILLAEQFGLPVSTTHILSSGVAGASVAHGGDRQRLAGHIEDGRLSYSDPVAFGPAPLRVSDA